MNYLLPERASLPFTCPRCFCMVEHAFLANHEDKCIAERGPTSGDAGSLVDDSGADELLRVSIEQIVEAKRQRTAEARA